MAYKRKKKTVFKKRLFSVVSRDCAYGSKEKKMVFYIYTDGNRRSVHLYTPFKQGKGQRFDFHSEEKRSDYKIF